MRLSVILPTIYPILADRLITALVSAPRPADFHLEIVIVSKEPPPTDEMFLWIPEPEPMGNNLANRAAFIHSTGEAVLCLCDELIPASNVWQVVMDHLPAPGLDQVVAMDGGGWTCFDKTYACLPLMRREVVQAHWNYFYPYTAHWGDPAFSMDVWRSGGQVIRPSSVPFTWGDRMGTPESQHKLNFFHKDCERFLKDFADMAKGWDTTNWQNFNRPAR